MARGLRKWSQTAASNSSADSGVNWAEGMAPSAVNDSARAEMASMAKWRDDNNGTLSATLSTATYSVTTNQVIDTVAAGDTLAFQLGSDMPATALLNPDTLGAKPLRPIPGAEFLGGEYKSGQIIRATYATTNSGEWIVNGTLSSLALTGVNISGGTSLTGVASNDELPIYDLSATANKQTTVSELFKAFSFAGAQLPYGAVYNGTIVESNGTNAVTFALKTLAGADPSASDPVLLCFRNATAATGNYVFRSVTAALSLTISSGSTMGFASGVAGKLWIVLFDDAGTIRMGAINCISGASTYVLGKVPLVSSTAEGGSGGADSAQVFYTGTAVTTKPYLIFALADYASGLATAGSWNASPTTLQLYGPGIPLQDEVQTSSRQISKAWANVTVPTTVNNGYNVASVAKNSTGNYSVTFTTALANANYVSFVTISPTGNGLTVGVVNTSTSVLNVQFFNLAGAAADPSAFQLLVFGD